MAGEYVPVALERLVVERACGRCEYCQCPQEYSTQTFEMEHIHPRALGGTTEADNLALACGGCNDFKGIKVDAVAPDTGEVVALFNPRVHVWSEHFRWSQEGLLMEGLSGIGSASISALRLNRPGVMNLRRLLMLDDRHPPND